MKDKRKKDRRKSIDEVIDFYLNKTDWFSHCINCHGIYTYQFAGLLYYGAKDHKNRLVGNYNNYKVTSGIGPCCIKEVGIKNEKAIQDYLKKYNR